MNLTFFNFGKRNRLSLCPVVDDDDYNLVIGHWLSGRLFGHYISLMIPWRYRR
jgi:hypothetical protein